MTVATVRVATSCVDGVNARSQSLCIHVSASWFEWTLCRVPSVFTSCAVGEAAVCEFDSAKSAGLATQAATRPAVQPPTYTRDWMPVLLAIIDRPLSAALVDLSTPLIERVDIRLDSCGVWNVSTRTRCLVMARQPFRALRHRGFHGPAVFV